MNTLKTGSTEFLRLFRSPLSLRIVFWIFVSIAAIEAILLIPSVEKRKQELLSKIEEISDGKVSWILTTYPTATGPELLSHVQQLYGNPMLRMIVGGAVYGPNGQFVGSFGESPVMRPIQDQHDGQLYLRSATGDRYEVVWPVPRSEGHYSIILRHNAAFMQPELLAYTLRIAGLVLIIAAFVTLVMMITLGPLIIFPILSLRGDLARAGKAVLTDDVAPQFDSTRIQRRDEIGEVITAFEQMFSQIQQAIAARKQAEHQLLQNNQNMEQYIQEANQITAAAMDVECGSFDPQTLSRVAQRQDELGNLARVFQRMATEVKQREEQLKQQVAELKIEIDQQKREKDVSQVVQSGYFKELQQEIGAINLDEYWS